ncbi:MAG: hypothetical protein ACM3Q1_18395 [Bacteroidales bacterium]
MFAFAMPRLAVITACVCILSGVAQARVEMEEGGLGVEPVPLPIVRVAPPRDPAWPLVTGGIPMDPSAPVSFTPYALSNMMAQPAPIIMRAAPRDDTSRLNAQRSLSRAHAFSRDLYKPINRDQIRVMTWYDW